VTRDRLRDLQLNSTDRAWRVSRGDDGLHVLDKGERNDDDT
jgi:hypothetical protein